MNFDVRHNSRDPKYLNNESDLVMVPLDTYKVIVNYFGTVLIFRKHQNRFMCHTQKYTNNTHIQFWRVIQKLIQITEISENISKLCAMLIPSQNPGFCGFSSC